MLYLLAGKHGLHVGKDESPSGADSDQQGGHQHRHDGENRSGSTCQHVQQGDEAGMPKKKLSSSRSCSVTMKNATGTQPASDIRCKHQVKEKSDHKPYPLQRSATVDIESKIASNSYRPADHVEREDGEKSSPKRQSPRKEKLKTEAKAKSFKQQTSSEDLLAKKKRCAYHRAVASADPT